MIILASFSEPYVNNFDDMKAFYDIECREITFSTDFNPILSRLILISDVYLPFNQVACVFIFEKKLRHFYLTTLQRRMSTFLLWFRNILLMTHYQNLCARPSLLLTCRMQKTIKDPGVLGKYLELF